MKKIGIGLMLIGLVTFGCGKKNPDVIKPKDTTKITTPVDTNQQVNANGSGFNADSAYAYVSKQMSFGPRVPNSKEHKACGDYLIAGLKKYCDNVIIQSAKVASPTLGTLSIRNIMGRFDEKNPNRIVLFAHWDTRYTADRTANTKSQKVPGADDGASGVGILMEIARQLKSTKAKVGVDIVFFDAEDQGDQSEQGKPESWCLGSQYWSKNKPVPGYTAKYGILLDMVGARGATFLKEGYSMQYASSVVEKVWNTASSSGYGGYFLMNTTQNPVTDDHFYVNTLAKIPTIDIINYDDTRGGFGPHWHTPNDNIDIIDKNVLKAVGQTLLNVIYTEQ
jgi:Zn-dependent M28 family amino/carboxypeptidase